METTGSARDAGRLLGDALAGAVRSIGRTHLSVSRRAFDAIGPAAEPVRTVHDGMTTGVYSIVAGAHHVVPRVGAVAVDARRRSSTVATEAVAWRPTSRSARVLGALNGLKGDTVSASYPGLAFPMALRDHVSDGDVAPTSSGLTAAYPAATGRIALFVHGLCETDRSWWDGAAKRHDDPDVSYGTLLDANLGYTPAYLRYNSGLPIADNARELSALLDEVVASWPVAVDEIALIGHSLGGLVIRSACHHGELDGRAWVQSVRHVICLGTPHLGAPLEQGVDRLVPVLGRFPETEPLAAFLRDRSAGVKDLRHGVFVDDEPVGDDAAPYLRLRRTEVPFVDGATYHFVAATVTRDREHPLGRIAGDLLVRYASASGSDHRRTIPFESEHGAHVGGVNHFQLVNHPVVYEHLEQWLSAAEPTHTSEAISHVTMSAASEANAPH